jgi:NAD(P) transhydrogenase
LERNHVTLIRGRASLQSANRVEVQRLDGSRLELLRAAHLLATGSRPRHVPAIVQVDHEHVLDSDSILSLPYMPRSLIVLGSGVIACEYASIFAALGCEVTLVDKAAEPLGFLDAGAAQRISRGVRGDGRPLSRRRGGRGGEFRRYLGSRGALKDGRLLTDIVFAAFGRVANLDGIGLDRLQLGLNARGHVAGRRALRDQRSRAFTPPAMRSDRPRSPAPPPIRAAAPRSPRSGLGPPAATDLLPTGVYTIPEIACVGFRKVRRCATNSICRGRADFSEVARAHIAGEPAGFLRLLCERGSMRVLGAQAIGEGATELVHLGQLAIAAHATAEYFVDHMFNFPTMTEAYRIAAFDCLKQRVAEAHADAAPSRLKDCESEYRRIRCT